MKKLSIISILVLWSASTIAEEVKKLPMKKAVPTEKRVELKEAETNVKPDEVKEDHSTVAPTNIRNWGAYATYSYFDTWLPGKWGITGSYGAGDRKWEFAFQQASIDFDAIVDDLGHVRERRIHLSTRSHTWGGSFNFEYGVYYNNFQIDLGTLYTSLLSDNYSVVEFTTLGVMWGVGNRWTLGNGLSFGADWFKIFWPLTSVDSDSDFIDDLPEGDEKDDAEDLIDAVSSIPTFSLFHLEIGYRF